MNQPEVGPYRILRRLGSGGMGEVYLAEDTRLGRHVAIKRLRSDAESSPDRRERLWREAKAAAGINHPSVVQIHDVLTVPAEDGGSVDYIVMEYVEGPTLRQQLEAHHLSAEQILSIAEQVASGLASAHSKGVVHRDLKSENILLTADGRPKIADFGIAKRVLPDGQHEESLTAHRHVLGTCRAMAPEQARGGEVDHRTDLFAFGVLLYEAFTGTSPFEAENAYTTLSRVLVHQPPPAAEIAPAVPAELSNLIGHLLQKEPELRPRSAREVAHSLREIAQQHGRSGLPTPPEGTPVLSKDSLPSSYLEPTSETLLAHPTAATVLLERPRPRWRRAAPWIAAFLIALALGGTVLFLRPAPPALVVAVLEPTSQPGDTLSVDEAQTLRDAVRFAELRSLVTLEGIAVKPPSEVDAAGGRSYSGLAAEVGAQALVATEIGCLSQVCRISLNRVAADGNLEDAASFEAPREDLRLLASAVETYTRRAFAAHRPRSGAAAGIADDEQLRDFLELRRRAQAETDPPERLLEEVEELRRRSDPFAEIDYLAADLARRAFVASHDPRFLERARTLLRDARSRAPEDPRWAVSSFTLALTASDLEGAESALAELERLAPG
ncbi:MAG: serine/threonine protein kinase, partial [Acidobacteria bacterium]|nr:serine/threonine protein kinase [Acidobacteriota bacterium]